MFGWYCPDCGYRNFSSKSQCAKCGYIYNVRFLPGSYIGKHMRGSGFVKD